MIDWKEVYAQVKPLFATYYQWNVIFLVLEGLSLILVNYLVFKYLKKTNWISIFAFFIMIGNVFFIYQAFKKLSMEIKVVEIKQDTIIGMYCGSEGSYSTFNADTIFVLNNKGIEVLYPNKINVGFDNLDTYTSTYADTISMEEMSIKLTQSTYDSLIASQPTLSKEEKQKQWNRIKIEKELELINLEREEMIRQEEEGRTTTQFIVFINAKIVFSIINSQGKVLYKISDKKLKKQLFEKSFYIF